jgi:RNA polymerase sigma factor for flagellar operon FliA
MLTEAMTLRTARPKGDAQSERDRLISRNLPLVYHVARGMLRSLSDAVDIDDLVSAGTVGLIRAVDGFDANRGVTFSTYATTRIRGAILDDLRGDDRLSRTQRRHQRRIASAEQALAAAFSRVPTDHEVAGELGIDVDTLWVWRTETRGADLVSLDQPVAAAHGRRTTPADVVEGASADDIVEEVAREEQLELLRREIGTLDERERTIMALYYVEELTQKQIAEVLELTESRVSQIRCQAIAGMRDRLSDYREDA